MPDYDGLVFPKLKKATAKRMPNAAYVIEEKLDGESLMLGAGLAFGRRISEVTGHRENKYHLMPPWLQALGLEVERNHLDLVHGELHVLGHTSSDVKSALISGAATGWTSELSQQLRFTAHWCHGTLIDRCTDPREHREYLIACGFEVPSVLKLEDFDRGLWVKHSMWKTGCTPVHTDPHTTFEQLLKVAERERVEGWVLKEVSTKRWWKLKTAQTYDVIVTGTKDGTGMFYGDVGALYVSVYDGNELVEVASVSGMTEAERKWMTDYRAELVGRVCEVEANGVGSQGRLRHPRFIRWRDDKPAHECTMDQLKGDEE